MISVTGFLFFSFSTFLRILLLLFPGKDWPGQFHHFIGNQRDQTIISYSTEFPPTPSSSQLMVDLLY